VAERLWLVELASQDLLDIALQEEQEMRAMEAAIKATMNLPVRPIPLRSQASCCTSSTGCISQGLSTFPVLVKHGTLSTCTKRPRGTRESWSNFSQCALAHSCALEQGSGLHVTTTVVAPLLALSRCVSADCLSSSLVARSLSTTQGRGDGQKRGAT
jgi:hypothetical protein